MSEALEKGRLSAFILVRRILGLVLLVAASLKVYELTTGLGGSTGSFSSPSLIVAVIELEILLGLWLLAGLYPRGAWAAALIGFSLLAGASLYLAVQGRPSCGCLGKLAVNPWYTFVFDILAVAALVLYHPPRWSPASSGSVAVVDWLRSVIYITGGATMFLAIGCVVLLGLGRSPTSAIAVLRGESLTIEPSLSDVGRVANGDTGHFRIWVRNHTDRAIRIVGGSADCSCVATEDLPTLVPERGTKAIRVKVDYRKPVGHFERSYILYTDDATQPVVAARVSGYIVEPAKR